MRQLEKSVMELLLSGDEPALAVLRGIIKEARFDLKKLVRESVNAVGAGVNL